MNYSQEWIQGNIDGFKGNAPSMPDNLEYMAGWDNGYQDRMDQYRY